MEASRDRAEDIVEISFPTDRPRGTNDTRERERDTNERLYTNERFQRTNVFRSFSFTDNT